MASAQPMSLGVIPTGGKQNKQMTTKPKTAILVIEFQKTWTEKSFFHKLIKKEYEAKKVYGHTKHLLEIARKNGITVIQSPFILDKSDKERYKKIPFLPKLFGQFTANTWKVEYTEGIFAESDIEVKGRYGFDNTKGSNLQEILRENKIERIYFVGFTTDHCVAETMATLISAGYECILVSDCTATRNGKLQQKIEDKYKSIKSKQLIEEIEK
ncbi:MAG: cysteine hydrolase family protein [Nitrospirae bacterium]|nr:cysteine hydrolase family protein [Nitrospirota bacterium]